MANAILPMDNVTCTQESVNALETTPESLAKVIAQVMVTAMPPMVNVTPILEYASVNDPTLGSLVKVS